MPWLAMFLSANAGGFIADAMRARDVSITTVRKIMQSIGFLGPAAFLGLVSTTSDPKMAVAYMTTALALGSFSQSGVYANHQDIGPTFSGILLGIRYVLLPSFSFFLHGQLTEAGLPNRFQYFISTVHGNTSS